MTKTNYKKRKTLPPLRLPNKSQLIARREKLLKAFTAAELKNPVTRKSVKIALHNIDILLESLK